jgi:type II secretory pathway pseudopilin PulG
MTYQPSPTILRRRAEAGFTLAELAVTLLVMSQLVIAAALVFDFQNRVAKIQGETSEMQQTARVSQMEIARYIRQAGRGGLAQNTPSLPQVNLGAAISVRNNVTLDADRKVAQGWDDSPLAVTGSDILTIRGAFQSPIFLAEDNEAGSAFFVLRDDGGAVTRDSTQAREGQLHLCELSQSGWRQSLADLRTAIQQAVPEALLLQSTLKPDIYAVVALDPAASSTSSALCAGLGLGQGVDLRFDVSGGVADSYRQLSPVTGATGMLPNITNIAFVAILEEHAFFIKEQREITGDASSALVPRFSRLRMLPNSGLAHGDTSAADVDLGDNILDLQVSMALDTVNGGSVEVNSVSPASPQILETADGEIDDWLFNAGADDPTDAMWARPLRPATVSSTPWRKSRLYYLRLSMVSRTAQPEPATTFLSPELGVLEDRTYDPADSEGTDPDSPTQRRYLRRVVRSTVDLRNLS